MSTESVTAGNERSIAAKLESAVAEDLELPSGQRVDRRTTFVDLGLDSASIVSIAGKASEQLGTEVPPEWLFDHPTIQQLASFLAQQTDLHKDGHA
ncbi:acyl carrier protein [Streptomyces microflavus]|uniref:acyl carrier protein n=1 Tax=Streptomyces microflavus TaxID=1919 RepID=UPI003818C927